ARDGRPVAGRRRGGGRSGGGPRRAGPRPPVVAPPRAEPVHRRPPHAPGARAPRRAREGGGHPRLLGVDLRDAVAPGGTGRGAPRGALRRHGRLLELRPLVLDAPPGARAPEPVV